MIGYRPLPSVGLKLINTTNYSPARYKGTDTAVAIKQLTITTDKTTTSKMMQLNLFLGTQTNCKEKRSHHNYKMVSIMHKLYNILHHNRYPAVR